MARSGFRPNYAGYRAVLLGNEARYACERAASTIAASAAGQSGIDYGIDSMQGLTRIHTRVSTQTTQDYYRERSYRALSIAVGAAGGHAAKTKGYKSLAKAQKNAMRKHNNYVKRRKARGVY